MSHIGKSIIQIPNNVFLFFFTNKIIIKGLYGVLEQPILDIIEFKQINQNLFLNLKVNKKKKYLSYYGLIHTLIKNKINGVNLNYSKILNLEGIGYKFQLDNNLLKLFVGFTHSINLLIPTNIKIILHSPTKLEIIGIDKELVGNFSSKIREQAIPDPYKGKGVIFQNEILKKKAGKTKK